MGGYANGFSASKKGVLWSFVIKRDGGWVGQKRVILARRNYWTALIGARHEVAKTVKYSEKQPFWKYCKQLKFGKLLIM